MRVRSDFRATALWLPDVTTDATGRATVPVRFPDSTTRWKATARACDAQTRVGEGYTGRARSAHQELRDRKVAFFLETLPQGLWELRYELRAETPGRYHALPTLGHAMYVPEIHANGEELRTSVVE